MLGRRWSREVAWYNARNKAGGGGGGGGGIGPSASNLSEATDATDDAAEDRDDNVGGAAIDDDDAENRSLASNASSASKANASKANASPALKKGSRQPLVPKRTLGRAAVPGPPPSPSRAPLAVQKKVEEKAEKEAEPPAVPSSPSITSLSGGSAKERAMAFSNARKSLAASRTAAADGGGGRRGDGCSCRSSPFPGRAGDPREGGRGRGVGRVQGGQAGREAQGPRAGGTAIVRE